MATCCFTPPCSAAAEIRGLCRSHYRKCRDAGTLDAMGLPAATRGGRKKGSVSKKRVAPSVSVEPTISPAPSVGTLREAVAADIRRRGDALAKLDALDQQIDPLLSQAAAMGHPDLGNILNGRIRTAVAIVIRHEVAAARAELEPIAFAGTPTWGAPAGPSTVPSTRTRSAAHRPRAVRVAPSVTAPPATGPDGVAVNDPPA